LLSDLAKHTAPQSRERTSLNQVSCVCLFVWVVGSMMRNGDFFFVQKAINAMRNVAENLNEVTAQSEPRLIFFFVDDDNGWQTKRAFENLARVNEVQVTSISVSHV
jgi:hypothetical protein